MIRCSQIKTGRSTGRRSVSATAVLSVSSTKSSMAAGVDRNWPAMNRNSGTICPIVF